MSLLRTTRVLLRSNKDTCRKSKATTDHFRNIRQEKEESIWVKLQRISNKKPESEEEIRFMRHGYYRATFCMFTMVTFAYMHPEYSYASALFHGSSEPLHRPAMSEDQMGSMQDHMLGTGVGGGMKPEPDSGVFRR